MQEAARRVSANPIFALIATEDQTHDDEVDQLIDLIDNNHLSCVFQPIIDFRTHSYIAFEGLIRGPEGSALHTPGQLFAVAERHGLRRQLEQSCRETVFRAFARLQLPGKLFINSSPDCLGDELFFNGSTIDLLHQIGISPSRVVIELTENQRITDYPDIQQTTASNGDVYYFSTEHLSPAYAASLAEWDAVERKMHL